ncbi:FAD-dependent thymidylate synthase [Candidatus Uhrbacteria bacterium]|nr:FAD-dependent thymidylate synthase [Candidatus Uhrbacteria bacterium]
MLTPEERSRIEPFVTNLDSSVFGFQNLPSVISGALFGRYSRSELGARELLAREFLGEGQEFRDALTGELNVGGIRIDPAKAEGFFSRVLDQYGDDSVAELGGTAIAVENISNVLAKIIEDRRIGLSPLEKSTRYVRFDRKDAAGEYPYVVDPDIDRAGHTETYRTAMNALFDTYTALIDPLMEELKIRFPKKDNQSDGAYRGALRGQACDVVRYLLPMSTKTNVGLVGNGRAFEYLMYHLRACGLAEGARIAKEIDDTLGFLIPAFVRRAKTDRGQGNVDYLASLFQKQKCLISQLVSDTIKEREHEATVRLIDFDRDGEQKIAAALCYDHSDMPYAQTKEFFAAHPEKVAEMIADILIPRKHRTHKPPRAFEHTQYLFEITCDIGAFRDLHRHRMLTQQRQGYTTLRGYAIPQDIKNAGKEGEYARAMDTAASAYETIKRDLPLQAQYCVPFGFLIRFIFRMNAREAYHLCELRSTIQGHPSYRYVAQEMAREIAKVHPNLGKGMMITWDGYDELARVASEMRQEQKARSRAGL